MALIDILHHEQGHRRLFEGFLRESEAEGLAQAPARLSTERDPGGEPRWTAFGLSIAWAHSNEGNRMLIWSIGVVVYIALFFWLGLSTLRNGHGWLFFFGIFFPIL